MSLLERIKDRWQKQQSKQMHRYNQLQAALMMYRGDHQWVWSESGRPVRKRIPTNLRSWFTVNLFQQIVRTVVANLTKGHLIGQVYPINATPEAREAARGAQALLEWLLKRAGYMQAVTESVYWALLDGGAYLKVVWDPELDISVEDAVGPNGEPVKVGVARGGIRVLAPCPQSIMIDDTAVELRDSPWLIHEIIISKDIVKLRYRPDWEPEEDAAGAPYSSAYVVQAGLSKSSYGSPLKSGVRVLEYWEKPTPENPGGVYAVVANDKFLVEPRPWPFARLPFVYWKAEIDPGQFHGRSFMWDMIPIQKTINAAFSAIVDHIRKSPSPPLLAPKGAITGGKIEQHTGREVIEYDVSRGGVPRELPASGMDAWVEQFMKDLFNLSDIVTGVGAPVQGRAPFAQATGRALAFLIEMDQTKMGPIAHRLGDAIIEVCKLALEIWKQHSGQSVLLRIRNLEGGYDYIEVSRESLRYGDIDIDLGAVVSESQAVLNDTVQQWVHLGIMTPDEARRILSLGPRSWDDLDPYAQDRAWAKMNIGRLMQGLEPVVKPYMAWGVHYEVTAEFMKGKQYLLETPPEIQANFEQYLQYLQQQTQANIQAQQAIPPQGGAQPANQGNQGGPVAVGMPTMRGRVLNIGGNPVEEEALQQRMQGG